MASLENGAANASTFLVEFAIERRVLRATQGLNLVTTVGRHAEQVVCHSTTAVATRGQPELSNAPSASAAVAK